MKREVFYSEVCPKTCPFYNRQWPSNRRKSLCRLMREHNEVTNPVTKSVIREICDGRIEKGETTDCPFDESK